MVKSLNLIPYSIKKLFLFFILLIIAGTSVLSQDRLTPVDTTVITRHTTTINGEKITYTATTGTQPVCIDDVVVATLYYTYYTRDIPGNRNTRPLLISFNGGPGSAGGFIPEAEKEEVAKKMSYYSGISKKAIIQHNLDLPTQFFWKELLRNKNGHTIGRLDSRYLGLDKYVPGWLL